MGRLGGELKDFTTMSERSKIRRKEREEKQEKQANHVINWIFGVLIALAVIFAIGTIMMQ